MSLNRPYRLENNTKHHIDHLGTVAAREAPAPMKSRSLNTPLFVAAFLAVSTGVFGAETPASPVAPVLPPVPASAKPVAPALPPAQAKQAASVPLSAKPDKPLPADVQKVMDQFSAQRDAMIADHQKLIDQLKTATAEQRAAIMAQMHEQQKGLLEAQRVLGKQIRDDLRRLRQSQPAGGGR
jgi:hypothetical protein